MRLPYLEEFSALPNMEEFYDAFESAFELGDVTRCDCLSNL